VETLNILEKREKINWEYDKEADVLYISIGEPGKAVGLDVGEGVIVRYDEKKRDVVGLTIIGVKQRSLMALMGEKRKSS